MFSTSRLVSALVLLLFACTGCGAGSGTDAGTDAGATNQDESRPLVAEDRLVEHRLVTDGEIRKARPASAERAFLEYWSALSYEDWATAVRYLDVTLRRVFDPAYLVPALRIEAQNNLPVKPVLRGVRRTRSGVSVRYMVRTGDGRLRATSSSWEQRKGVWYLVYSSTMDDSYGAAVQQSVQNDLDPAAKEVSRRALSAGMRARGVQAKTLKPLPTSNPKPEPPRRAAPRATATAAPTASP